MVRRWVTSRTKDGLVTLNEPFYSTNPMYVAQRKDWDWQECSFILAVREVARALGTSSPDIERA